MPQLKVIAGPVVETTFAIPIGFSTIGREADAHVYLADAEISRRHATLQRDGGRVNLTDLGSTNGTSVNGRRMHDSQELRIGDVIRIGPIELVYGSMSRRIGNKQQVGRERLASSAPSASSGRVTVTVNSVVDTAHFTRVRL